MSVPQPKDILFRAGGITLERFGVPVWRRAPISRGGEEWKETLARADGATPVATLLGRDGLYHLVAQNTLRVEWVPNIDVGDGLGPRTRASLLLEGSRTNKLAQPLNFAAWLTANGPPAPTGGQADPFGGTGAFRLTDNSAVATQLFGVAAAFVGDGTKGMGVFLKQGTAAVTTVDLFDITAAAKRVRIDVTWNGANAPTLTVPEGAGQTWAPFAVPGAPGWWWITYNGQGIVAANANQFRVLPAGNPAGNTGTVFAYLAQAEDGVFPSSPLPTTIARAQDALTVPIGFGLRVPMTVLIRLVTPRYLDTGGNGVGIPGVLTIGSSQPDLRIWLPTAGGTVRAGLRDSVGGDDQSGAAHPVGPLVQAAIQITPSGAGIVVAVDAGAGLSAPSAVAQRFNAWHDGVLHIGDLSGAVGSSAYMNLLDAVGFDGQFALADCLAVP